VKHLSVGMHVILALLAGAAVGFLALFWFGPAGILDPESTVWAIPKHDIMAGLIGHLALIQSDWSFPLLLAETLEPPSGRVVLSHDSNPAASLVCKALGVERGCYPEWYALTFILQGMAGALLAWAIGARRGLLYVLMGGLAVMLPAYLYLFYRFGHIHLTAHFLIIACLALYFLYARQPRALWLALQGGCVGLAITVHPYLVVMCLAIAAATYADAFFRRRLDRRTILAWAGAFAVLLPALMGVLGYFSESGRAPDDFGHNSMNLVSPVVPQVSWLAPWDTPVVDATGGQESGMNYLGAGVLLLIAVALFLRWRDLGRGLRDHVWLVIILVGLFAFSLSNRVYVFDHLVMDLGGKLSEDNPLHIFRASGRFFWPVAYSLIAFAVLALMPIRQRLILAGVTVGVLGLQVLDTQTLKSPSPLGADAAARIMEPVDGAIDLVGTAGHIRFAQRYHCNQYDEYACPKGSETQCEEPRSADAPILHPQTTQIRIALAGARAGLSLENLWFGRELTRHRPRRCPMGLDAALAEPPAPDEALIIFRPGMEDAQQRLPALEQQWGARCSAFAAGWVCVSKDGLT